MLTDAPPRHRHRASFLDSDRIETLNLPESGVLPGLGKAIESAMQTGKTADVRRACADFLVAVSEFYEVPDCGIRVLSARPLRVRENWTTELFGDYDPRTQQIRVWMRTAVRKDVTSFGTFLSTLCHEFCHHLDFQRFRSADSWHTRGFYERAAALYHCARYAAKEAVLGSRAGWALEDRLAANESGCLRLSLAVYVQSSVERASRRLGLRNIVDVRNPAEDADFRAIHPNLLLPCALQCSHEDSFVHR